MPGSPPADTTPPRRCPQEIRFATTSPTPMPARGTGLPASGSYAATGDVRPRPAVTSACSGAVDGRIAGAVVDAVSQEQAVVLTPAAVRQQVTHRPFLPLQGVHPRGAPV